MNVKELTRVGEAFGVQLAEIVNAGRVRAVTITEVRGDKAWVTTFDGDEPTYVPLSLLGVNNSLLRVVPTVGTTALVVNANGNLNSAHFIAFEKIDRVELRIGDSLLDVKTADDGDTIDLTNGSTSVHITNEDTKLTVGESSVKITPDNIVMNGGGLGTLVVAEKLTERLNTLVKQLNQIQGYISAHTHTLTAGPYAGVTTGTYMGKLTLPDFKTDDFSNPKIKQ